MAGRGEGGLMIVIRRFIDKRMGAFYGRFLWGCEHNPFLSPVSYSCAVGSRDEGFIE